MIHYLCRMIERSVILIARELACVSRASASTKYIYLDPWLPASHIISVVSVAESLRHLLLPGKMPIYSAARWSFSPALVFYRHFFVFYEYDSTSPVFSSAPRPLSRHVPSAQTRLRTSYRSIRGMPTMFHTCSLGCHTAQAWIPRPRKARVLLVGRTLEAQIKIQAE